VKEERDERIYLGHIRDAINDIKAYASVGEEAFFGVDLGLVWRVVARDLQALEAAVAVLRETSATSDQSQGST
jgi:uncharacterized protein with HEPN domain